VQRAGALEMDIQVERVGVVGSSSVFVKGAFGYLLAIPPRNRYILGCLSSF